MCGDVDSNEGSDSNEGRSEGRKEKGSTVVLTSTSRELAFGSECRPVLANLLDSISSNLKIELRVRYDSGHITREFFSP